MKKIMAYVLAIVCLSIITLDRANADPVCPSDADTTDYCSKILPIRKCLNALPCWEIEKVYGQQFGQTPYVKNNGRLDYFVIGEGYDQNTESRDHEILFQFAQQVVKALHDKEPYKSYPDFFNVHLVWLTAPPESTDPYESKIDYPLGYPFSDNKIIVDNSDLICDNGANCFEKISGDWPAYSGTPGNRPFAFYGSEYLVSNEIGDQVKWIFRIPVNGEYKIFVSVTNDSSNTTAGAEYEVYRNDDASAWATSKVDQSNGLGQLTGYETVIANGRWSAGDIIKVFLTNTNGSTVVADAVGIYQTIKEEIDPQDTRYWLTPFDGALLQSYPKPFINTDKLNAFLGQPDFPLEARKDIPIIYYNGYNAGHAIFEGGPIFWGASPPTEIFNSFDGIIHEDGHALGILRDEYTSIIPHKGEGSHYPDYSPSVNLSSANINSPDPNPGTGDENEAIPWSKWLDVVNGCSLSHVDIQGNWRPYSLPVYPDEIDRIGIFPSTNKQYAPTQYSLMWGSGDHSAPSQEQIAKRLHLLNDVIYGAVPGDDLIFMELGDSQMISINVLGYGSLNQQVKWFWDNNEVAADTLSFMVDSGITTTGIHKLKVEVREETPMVRERSSFVSKVFPYWGIDDLLTEEREWTVMVGYDGSFRLVPSSPVNLTYPETVTFSAIGTFREGASQFELDITQYVDFVSLSPSIADFINDDNVLHSRNATGSGLVGATFVNQMAMLVVDLNVSQKPIVSLTLSPHEQIVPAGVDYSLSLIARYGDDTSSEVRASANVVWSISYAQHQDAQVISGVFRGNRTTIVQVNANLGSLSTSIILYVGDWPCKPEKLETEITSPITLTMPTPITLSHVGVCYCPEEIKHQIQGGGYVFPLAGSTIVKIDLSYYMNGITPKSPGTANLMSYFANDTRYIYTSEIRVVGESTPPLIQDTNPIGPVTPIGNQVQLNTRVTDQDLKELKIYINYGQGFAGYTMSKPDPYVSIYSYSTSLTLTEESFSYYIEAKDWYGNISTDPDQIQYPGAYYEVHHADSDLDGLTDQIEFGSCTDPFNPDTDGDGLLDGAEDSDRDGNLDPGETSPCLADTDGDGMSDGWEAVQSGCVNPRVFDSDADPDGDGIYNYWEFRQGSNPCNPDTDSDGMEDGYEAEHADCVNPVIADADGDPDQDLLTSLEEFLLSWPSDPCRPDTDSGLEYDGFEAWLGRDPTQSSDDRGWSACQSAGEVSGFNPRVVSDDQGNFHVIYETGDRKLMYLRVDSGGLAQEQGQIADLGPDEAMADLDVGPTVIHVVWTDQDLGTLPLTSRIMYSTKPTVGGGWSPAVDLLDDALGLESAFLINPRIAVSSTGAVSLAFGSAENINPDEGAFDLVIYVGGPDWVEPIYTLPTVSIGSRPILALQEVQDQLFAAWNQFVAPAQWEIRSYHGEYGVTMVTSSPDRLQDVSFSDARTIYDLSLAWIESSAPSGNQVYVSDFVSPNLWSTPEQVAPTNAVYSTPASLALLPQGSGLVSSLRNNDLPSIFYYQERKDQWIGPFTIFQDPGYSASLPQLASSGAGKVIAVWSANNGNTEDVFYSLLDSQSNGYGIFLGCEGLAPLSGAFYFGDSDGDGMVETDPDVERLKSAISGVPANTDCTVPEGWRLLFDMSGDNGIASPLDLKVAEILADGYDYPSGVPGQAREIFPSSATVVLNHLSGEASLSATITTGAPNHILRTGFGLVFQVQSATDSEGCLALRGRDPSPTWPGPRDQFIESDEVFAISDGDGFAAIEAGLTDPVNPDCVGQSITIDLFVPSDTYVENHYAPISSEYQFQNKQAQWVSATITVTIE